MAGGAGTYGAVALWLSLCTLCCGRRAPEPRPGPAVTPFLVKELDRDRRRVVHGGEEAVVPAHPRRIAAIAYTDEEVIALGFRPVVYSTFWGGTRPYSAFALRGAVGVEALLGGDPSLELLALARPDLILTDSRSRHRGPLAAIAPLVVVDGHDNAEERLRQVARTLGVPERAEAILAAYHRKVANARAVLAERHHGETVALLRVRSQQLQLLGGTGWRYGELLYDQLGLGRPRFVREHLVGSTAAWMIVDPEAVRDLDADHLFVAINPPITSERYAAGLEDTDGWSEVPAVKKGNVYYVGLQNWMSGGIVQRGVIIDEVVTALLHEGRYARRADTPEARRAALIDAFRHPMPALREPLNVLFDDHGGR